MFRRLLFVTLLTGLLLSCNKATQKTTKASEQDVPSAELPKGETFGAAFTPEGVLSYSGLLKEMEGKDSLAAIVEGTVQEVCQMKGCWMTITSEGAGKEPAMVRFKDYGFFVPKDISGRRVIMNGQAFREVTPVEELRHYAEDAGKSEEEIAAITEPKEELKFLASGVLLLEEKK